MSFYYFNEFTFFISSGWLTCVPEQQTRAYCLYCRKDLHAHRLSLLKHMCTIKHQRSAQNYQDHQSRKRNQYNSATLKNEVEADDKVWILQNSSQFSHLLSLKMFHLFNFQEMVIKKCVNQQALNFRKSIWQRKR